MLATDNLTYSYRNRSSGSGSNKLAERSLITLERSQKLDLLIHLLTNLQKTLVVIGPQGIGKTTLLKALQSSHASVWPICLLPGSSALSFESVISRLSQFLKLSRPGSGFDLASLRDYCAKQKTVLIIEDAGNLVPGLIGELMDLANSLKGLRFVFSMTDDDFQAQAGSDQAIEACHLIEMPPLTQAQCLEYLQNLSAQPDAILTFNSITELLVEELYLQTQGIPGKILAELPRFQHYKNRQNRKLILWAGMALLILIAAIAYQFVPINSFLQDLMHQPALKPVEISRQPPSPPIALSSKQTAIDSHQPEPVLLMPEPLTPALTPSEQPLPVIAPFAESTDITTSLPVHPPIDQAKSVAVTPEQKTDAVPAQTNSAATINTAPESQNTKKLQADESPSVSKEPSPAKQTKSDISDQGWIMAQPANFTTLQIMVLSSKESANRFIKKYSQYREQLKYYAIGQADQEKYVLIFGSFPSAAAALEQKANLPAEFNQSLAIPFKQIQYQNRRKH